MNKEEILLKLVVYNLYIFNGMMEIHKLDDMDVSNHYRIQINEIKSILHSIDITDEQIDKIMISEGLK